MTALETYVEDGGECKPAYVHFADGVTIEVPASAPTYDAMPRARIIAAAPTMAEEIDECANEADYALRFKNGESVEELRKSLYKIKCALESVSNEARGRPPMSRGGR